MGTYTINDYTVTVNGEQFLGKGELDRILATVNTYTSGVMNGTINPSQSPTKIEINVLQNQAQLIELNPILQRDAGAGLLSADGTTAIVWLVPSNPLFDPWIGGSLESLVVHELTHGFYNLEHGSTFQETVLSDSEKLGIDANWVDSFFSTCFTSSTPITRAARLLRLLVNKHFALMINSSPKVKPFAINFDENPLGILLRNTLLGNASSKCHLQFECKPARCFRIFCAKIDPKPYRFVTNINSTL